MKVDLLGPTSLDPLKGVVCSLTAAVVASSYYPQFEVMIWKGFAWACLGLILYMSHAIRTHPILARRNVLRASRRKIQQALQQQHSPTAPSTICICTSGKLGSGKNTASDALKQILSSRLKQVYPASNIRVMDDAFARRLKCMLAAVADIPLDDTMTQQGKNGDLRMFGTTVGEALQDQGELFRWFYGEDLWSSIVFQENRQARTGNNYDGCDYDNTFSNKGAGNGDIFILNITDGRYPNEIDDVMSQRLGFTIRVVGDPNGTRAASKRDLAHASETALDAYDRFSVVIDNSQHGLELLTAQLEDFVDRVIMPRVSNEELAR